MSEVIAKKTDDSQQNLIKMDDREAKTAFAYHQDTGEYLGTVLADPDQLDAHNWLLPAYATFIAPPEAQANQVALFDGQAWTLTADFRGTIYWNADGEEFTIDKVAQPLPEGALLEAPELLPTLAEQTFAAKAECSRRINAKWDQVGQVNAALGIYSDEECDACADWIDLHRAALNALLDQEDLLDLEVTDDQYWPLASAE